MTIQVRAKRRLLPKRSIVDVDFISPTTTEIQELLLTTTSSEKHRHVIDELLGKENKQQLPQVVVGVPKHSRLVQEKDHWSDFFLQHSIIPHNTDNRENPPPTQKSDRKDIGLTSDNRDDSPTVDTIRNVLIIENKDSSMVIGNNDCSLTKESLTTKPVASHEVGDKDEASADDKSEKEEWYEPTIIIQEKRKESFMLLPNKLPKRQRSHETIKALKDAGILYWHIDTKDTDPRKHDIGKVRKRQLESRLCNRNAKKKIRNKREFVIQ